MAGPSAAYLADLNAALGAVDGGEIEYPPPIDLGDVDAPLPYQPNPGRADYNPNPAPPPRQMQSFERAPAPVDLGDIDAPEAGPAAVPVGMSAGPPPRPQPPEPFRTPEPDVQTQMVSRGGSTPAGEAHIRGPIQESLLASSFRPPEEAAQRASLRAQMAAQHEADVYDLQAEQALKQQEAYEAMAQKRAQELQALHADYMSTIQQMGDAKIDSGRLWANTSTLDRIGAIALTILGGDKVVNAIQKKIDDDVKLQMWDYERHKDVANAKHTAYSMAMQQYGQEDAAHQAAQAAGQLATAAKMRSLASQWKGTETANHLDMLAAGFEHDAAQSAAAGWKFVPPTFSAPQYRMAVNGFELPAPVSGAEANRITLEHGAKPTEALGMERTKGGIQSTIEDQKLRAQGAAKGQEGARFIASQLQSAGIPKARATAEAALQALNKSPGSTAERVARATTPDVVQDIVGGEDANAREQAWQAFANEAMKVQMGNVTAGEEVRSNVALGNKSPAGRKRAIAAILHVLAEEEKAIKASDPEAARQYDESRKRVQGAPPTAPTGVKAGW